MRRVDYSTVVLSSGFIILFFNAGTMFTLGLVLKPMSEDLGWSRSTLTLAATIFMVVSALSMPVYGRLMDRYSPRVVIAVAVAVSAVGIGLMGSVTEVWQALSVYGGLYALGAAGTSIATVGIMVSRWFVRRRGIANSAAITGQALGQLVIITALAALISTVSWRAAFWTLGAANAFVLLPIVLALVRSRRPGESPASEPSPKTSRAVSSMEEVEETGHPASIYPLLRSQKLLLLVVIYAVCGFQDFFVATHVVAFAEDSGVGRLLAGNLLAMMGVFGLLGVLAAGWLSDTFGPARPTVLCFILRIFIFALILYVQSTAGILVFALLYGSTFLITAPLLMVFAGRYFGSARLGVVTGFLSMVHQMAGGLGAFIGGWIFDTWNGYDGAFLLLLAMAVLGTVTTLALRDSRQRLAVAPA